MTSFLILPARDLIYNEIRLTSLKEQTEKYSHPPDSQLIQRLSLIGNFASASNQCGFIIADVLTTKFEPNQLKAFYKPILTTLSYDNTPPYHEVNLYILTEEKDIESLKQFYSEVYELITYKAMNNIHTYLLMTSDTGYPPNYDLRCH